VGAVTWPRGGRRGSRRGKRPARRHPHRATWGTRPRTPRCARGAGWRVKCSGL